MSFLSRALHVPGAPFSVTYLTVSRSPPRHAWCNALCPSSSCPSPGSVPSKPDARAFNHASQRCRSVTRAATGLAHVYDAKREGDAALTMGGCLRRGSRGREKGSVQGVVCGKGNAVPAQRKKKKKTKTRCRCGEVCVQCKRPASRLPTR